MKLIKDVIADETIPGVTSCIERQSTADKAKGLFATTKVVIMDNFYLAITNKSLHYMEFNGQKAIEHLIFDLDNLQNIQIVKPSLADKAKFEMFSRLQATWRTMHWYSLQRKPDQKNRRTILNITHIQADMQ